MYGCVHILIEPSHSSTYGVGAVCLYPLTPSPYRGFYVTYTQAFDDLSSMPSLLLEVTRAAATKDRVGSFQDGPAAVCAPGMPSYLNLRQEQAVLSGNI